MMFFLNTWILFQINLKRHWEGGGYDQRILMWDISYRRDASRLYWRSPVYRKRPISQERNLYLKSLEISKATFS